MNDRGTEAAQATGCRPVRRSVEVSLIEAGPLRSIRR